MAKANIREKVNPKRCDKTVPKKFKDAKRYQAAISDSSKRVSSRGVTANKLSDWAKNLPHVVKVGEFHNHTHRLVKVGQYFERVLMLVS
jgi:hypothetical protein